MLWGGGGYSTLILGSVGKTECGVVYKDNTRELRYRYESTFLCSFLVERCLIL